MSDAMNTMHNSSTVACVVSSCLYLLRVNHNRRELNISHLKLYFVKLYGNIGSCWFLAPVMNIARPCPALNKSAIWKYRLMLVFGARHEHWKAVSCPK